MGMDVSGRHPTDKAGEYFRANVWSWRPLHTLIYMANSKMKHKIDDETMETMCHNDGAGPEDAETCVELADVLEQLLAVVNHKHLKAAGLRVDLENKRIGFPVERDCAVDAKGCFVGKDTKLPLDDLHSPYSIAFEHVREFCTFLRSCGGFEVC